MIIACLCGGIGEFAAIAGVVTLVSAWLTNWYNRRKCKKNHCYHNCKKGNR